MLRRVVELMERFSTARWIVAAIAGSVVCGVLPLRYAIERIRVASPDAAPLDMLASYTPDEAYAMLARYGAEARDYYVFNAFTVDIVGPAFFGLTVALAATALLRRMTPRASPWRAAAALGPLAGWVLDVVENVLLSILVLRFPERLDGLVAVASATTAIKRAVIFSTWGLVVGAALVLAGRAIGRAIGRPRVDVSRDM